MTDDAVHLFRGRGFADVAPVPPRIPAILAAWARQAPSRPCLTAVAADGTERTLTFAAVDTLTRRLAEWFRRTADVGAGTVAALAPANDLPSALAILALLRSGATTLLLNPADPVARKQAQMDAASARVAFATARMDGGLPGALELPDPDRLRDGDGPEAVPDIHDCAFLIGTSGSTAASKLVGQTHANLAANAAAVVAHHGLSGDDRFLGCLPIHHVNGLHFTLLANVAAGSHAVLLEGFSPFQYPRAIERYRPRIASVCPSILEALAATHRGQVLPGEFHYFVSAAAPLSATTARGVKAAFGRRVIQGYGLTETTNFSCTLPPDMPEALYARLVLDADIPSVGIAVAGNEVAILGPDGEPVAPGVPGEICMRGHNVMLGYVGNAAATAEAFRDGWFHSQDLGMEIRPPEGGPSCFVITGRAKNMAKVRGEAVSFDEVERALRSLPGIADAACLASPHPLHGETVTAVVVAGDDLTDEAIRAHLAGQLSPHAHPQRILRAGSIPRTLTGKIRRADLAERVQDGDRASTF